MCSKKTGEAWFKLTKTDITGLMQEKDKIKKKILKIMYTWSQASIKKVLKSNKLNYCEFIILL